MLLLSKSVHANEIMAYHCVCFVGKISVVPFGC